MLAVEVAVAVERVHLEHDDAHAALLAAGDRPVTLHDLDESLPVVKARNRVVAIELAQAQS